MSHLDVVILTFNEERHIARAIESVRPVARGVFVVDSFSRDRTVEIARSLGAMVLQHEFTNQARQFHWALDNVPFEADWILRLDADEIIEPALQEEIRERMPTLPTEVSGVNLKRKHVFLGRWVRHGGRYPLILLRIFRKGMGRVEDRWMDEHLYVTAGRTLTFEQPFSDWNLGDLSAFTDKHNRYATREAVDVLNRRYGLFAQGDALSAARASWQASVKRYVKESIYNRMPFPLSASLYFLWRYIFRLGFLDGRSGLVYHFLQGYWYRFLVGARVMELERALRGIEDKARMREELQRITGLRLAEESAGSAPAAAHAQDRGIA